LISVRLIGWFVLLARSEDSKDPENLVVGALGSAVGQAALQDRPACRVQWDRVRPTPEPDRPIGGMDAIEAQVADFAAGGYVQQGEDAVPLGNSVSYCDLGFCCGISAVAATILRCCCRCSTAW
jgi:hypothetical protein